LDNGSKTRASSCYHLAPRISMLGKKQMPRYNPSNSLHNPEKLFFAVLTGGRTASHWLTQMLSAHPKIFALQNGRNQLKRHLGKAMGITEYYDLLDHLGTSFDMAGDVHGVSLAETSHLKNKYGSNFRYAFMTRDPITRITSMKYMYPQEGFQRGLDMVNHVAQGTPLEMWDRVRYVNGTWLVGEAPIYKMEEITSEWSAVDSLLRYLAHNYSEGVNEAVSLAETVGGAFNKQRSSLRPGTNKFGSDRKIYSAEEDFEKWTGDERLYFRRHLNPSARRAYELMGYDLSFV